MRYAEQGGWRRSMPVWLAAAGLGVAGAAGAQPATASAGEREVEVRGLPELDGGLAVEVNVEPPGQPERERVHRVEPDVSRAPIPTRGVGPGLAVEAIPAHATEPDFEPTRVRTRGIDTRYHDTEIRTHRIGESDGGGIRYHGPGGRY